MKVIVVGAGYSGIYHGIRIPERIRNCELVIYDKNAGVGGTWFENRYPGCACDVPCKFVDFLIFTFVELWLLLSLSYSCLFLSLSSSPYYQEFVVLERASHRMRDR